MESWGTFPPFPLVRFHPPENKKDRQNNRYFFGAGGRNRTDMPTEDFEYFLLNSVARNESHTSAVSDGLFDDELVRVFKLDLRLLADFSHDIENKCSHLGPERHAHPPASREERPDILIP